MTKSAAATPGADLYRACFERFAREPERNGHSWLNPLRRSAMARFEATGIPTMREEEWLHTNVAALGKIAFQPSKRLNESEDDATFSEAIKEFRFDGDEFIRLVFVNGFFSEQHSSVDDLPEGLKIMSLAAALNSDAREIEANLGRYASPEKNAFVALNTAFIEDGAYISVGRGRVIERPIHLLYITTGNAEPTFTNPRNLIMAAENSQVSLVESYASLTHDVYFTNAVTEIVAAQDAVVYHYKVQQESDEAFHIGTVESNLGRGVQFVSETISVGTALTRNDLNVLLGGERIHCTLNGLYVGTARQHIDNHTRLEHAKPNCESHELFKGILDEHATGVFNGRIHVWQDAQKTDSKQSNKNLLLSDTATAFTEPQLEIYADDVKCTHGATVGQLDEDQIFYLQARGIDHETARGLLTYAFANEIIREIKIPTMRAKLEHLIFERFKRGRMTE